MRQLPLGVRLRDAARFAGFLPGRNRELLEALAEPAAARVWWLWGRPGSGKTHLLQATCAAAAEQGRTAACFDLAMDGSDPVLLEGCESLDWVCLDGIEPIAGDERWNRALFRLHTLMQDGTGRLLLASRLPPSECIFTLPDLRSRLLSGAIYQVHGLQDADQLRALQLRAARRGLDLSAEAAQYLANRLPRDTHSLFAVLDELDQAALAAQRRLTVPFLREVLEQRAAPHPADAPAQERDERK